MPAMDTEIETNQRPVKVILNQSSVETNDSQDELDLIEEEEEDKIRTPELDCHGKITEQFVHDLIKYFKHQRLLPRPTVHKIVKDAKELFKQIPSLVDVQLGRNDVVNVIGDLHGQFFDLANILHLFGPVSLQNRYLFNGDLVDRGVWSLEVVLLIFSLKLLHPEAVYINRGNHECEQINHLYGFENEVVDKYDTTTYDLIQKAFNWLPLAHCVNSKVLIMHGGLPARQGVTLADIRSARRGRQPDRKGIMCDLLWADPQEEIGISPNSRGFSIEFGPDVTRRFLDQNNLLYVVRSHECVPGGYDMCHDDKVITVFSAPNYCDKHTNKGAVCILHGDDVSMPEFRRFEAVSHPPVDSMKYASLLMRIGML